MSLHAVSCQNIFADFNPMPSCSSFQILSDCIKCRVDKPFCECCHNKCCSQIATNVILKGDVPSEILQRYLCGGRMFLNTNLGHFENLTVDNEISDTFADLKYLGFFKTQWFE